MQKRARMGFFDCYVIPYMPYGTCKSSKGDNYCIPTLAYRTSYISLLASRVVSTRSIESKTFLHRTVSPINKWPCTIIIIMSCRQHGYPWPSLATSPYRSSLLARPQSYISYTHRAAVCRFELVILLLLGHMRESIGLHHLWACPYFSSSVLHVWFV